MPYFLVIKSSNASFMGASRYLASEALKRADELRACGNVEVVFIDADSLKKVTEAQVQRIAEKEYDDAWS